MHAFCCEDGLCIDVSDDDVGLPPEEIAQLNERLKNPCPRTKDQADVHVGLILKASVRDIAAMVGCRSECQLIRIFNTRLSLTPQPFRDQSSMHSD